MTPQPLKILRPAVRPQAAGDSIFLFVLFSPLFCFTAPQYLRRLWGTLVNRVNKVAQGYFFLILQYRSRPADHSDSPV